MDNCNIFIDKINSSFLLNQSIKNELITYINYNKDKYNFEKINDLIDEKKFIRNFLKSLLSENSKDFTYNEIHNKMKLKYLQKIRELEEKEQESLDNIFNNFY